MKGGMRAEVWGFEGVDFFQEPLSIYHPASSTAGVANGMYLFLSFLLSIFLRFVFFFWNA